MDIILITFLIAVIQYLINANQGKVYFGSQFDDTIHDGGKGMR